MSRPLKFGANYFPLDVDIFSDKKVMLLKSILGYEAVAVYVAILCDIYGRDGYYVGFSDEDAFIMSERIGGGCKAAFVSEAVACCLDKGLFDSNVYKTYGVLTSKGIQERFIRICEYRKCIYFIEEYLVIDVNDTTLIQSNFQNRIRLLSVHDSKNTVKKVDCSNNYNYDKVNSVNEEVNSVNEEVNSVNEEVNSVNGEVNSVNGEVNSVNGEVNSVNGEVNSVNGEVNPVNGEVNSQRKGNKSRVNESKAAAAMPLPVPAAAIACFIPNSVNQAVTEQISESLVGWLDVFDAGTIGLAIKEALDYNAFNVKYINKILQNWKENGVKNDVNSPQRLSKTSMNRKSKNQKSRFANYKGRDWDFDELEKLTEKRLNEVVSGKHDSDSDIISHRDVLICGSKTDSS